MNNGSVTSDHSNYTLFYF